MNTDDKNPIIIPALDAEILRRERVREFFEATAQIERRYPQFQIPADIPAALLPLRPAEFGRDTPDGGYNFYRTEREWQMFLAGFKLGFSAGHDDTLFGGRRG